MPHTCKVHGCNEKVASDGLCWDHWKMLAMAESRPDFVDEETALFEMGQREEGWPAEPLVLPLQSEDERAIMERKGWQIIWVSVDGLESWSPPSQ